jgi:hypothetical protein
MAFFNAFIVSWYVPFAKTEAAFQLHFIHTLGTPPFEELNTPQRLRFQLLLASISSTDSLSNQNA